MSDDQTVQLPQASTASDLLETALFEIKRVIAGQDAMLERVLVCLLAGGHLLIEGVPGLAKTLTISTTAQVLGGTLRPRPVHARPRAVGPRRHAHLPRPRPATFDTEPGPGLLQLPARRRDQPRARQGAVRAARGHAGAPGHDRRRDARRAAPVPRHGHAEPDRAGGHVPAARGADRPLHAQGARRLPLVRGGADGRRALARRARAGAPGDRARPARGPAGRGRRRLRRPARHALRRPARQRHARARRRTAWPSSRPTSPTAPARAARSACCTPPARLALVRGRRYVLPADVPRARARRAAAPHRAELPGAGRGGHARPACSTKRHRGRAGAAGSSSRREAVA